VAVTQSAAAEAGTGGADEGGADEGAADEGADEDGAGVGAATTGAAPDVAGWEQPVAVTPISAAVAAPVHHRRLPRIIVISTATTLSRTRTPRPLTCAARGGRPW
jgi:hypothetical protein